MLEELTALAKIAEIDSTALQAETELKTIPERIAEIDADVGRVAALLEAERNELAEAQRLLRAQEQEIGNQHEALSRSKSKSARARNVREADAVERELEVVRRLLKEREAERDSLKEAIEKREATLAKHEEDFQKLQEFAAKEKKSGSERVATLRADYDQVLAGRDELAKMVPGPTLRRYNLIRERRGTGVALLKSDSCQGCNVAIAPQLALKVMLGESLEQCPNCQRFLCPLSLRPGAEQEGA